MHDIPEYTDSTPALKLSLMVSSIIAVVGAAILLGNFNLQLLGVVGASSLYSYGAWRILQQRNEEDAARDREEALTDGKADI